MAHGGRFEVEMKRSGLFWMWVVKDKEDHHHIVNSGTASTKLGARWAAKRAANHRVKTELEGEKTFKFDY